MPKDKMGIRGSVKARVIELAPEGLEELSALKEEYQGVEKPKLVPDYSDRLAEIYRKYGHLKRRTTFSRSVIAAAIRTAISDGIRSGLEALRYQVSTHHNIVTNEGDALVADLLQETPERTKLDNANAVIGVGTGFVSEAKTVDALVTQTGSDEGMDAGYPQTKGAWAAANDNVIVYVATFEAGDLNATGIDETLLGNGTDTMAYAEVDPAVDVAATDTLQMTWELTFLGA